MGSSVNTQLVKVGFIGAGNMAKSVAKGLIKSKVFAPSQIYASAPSDRNLSEWREWGANVTNDNKEIVRNCDFAFLATKPQQFSQINIEDTAASMEDYRTHLFLSLMAGVKICDLKKKLAFNSHIQVVRCLASTTCSVLAGFCAYAVDEEDIQCSDMVDSLFSPLGYCVRVKECEMNAVCGAFGSGVAYVYNFIDAMVSGSVKMGLSVPVARALSIQTILGAAVLAQSSDKHICQLRDEVTSPGGTTIHGLHALETGGFRNSVINAVESAVNRCKELSDIS